MGPPINHSPVIQFRLDQSQVHARKKIAPLAAISLDTVDACFYTVDKGQGYKARVSSARKVRKEKCMPEQGIQKGGRTR